MDGITPDKADEIHFFLNLEEKDIPEENRALFNFLRPSIEDYLLETITEIKL